MVARALTEITIADAAEAWIAAGFTVVDDTVTVDGVRLRLAGRADLGGITCAHVHGVAGPIDGMPFEAAEVAASTGPRPDHPNRVVALDHLVATTPDIDRTTEALEESGLELRRNRVTGIDGDRRRQAFFWLGTTILEVVGADARHDEGPATLWGLAFTCDDLDLAAAELGPRLGAVKPAVQEGRGIATLRTKDIGISIPVVLMSPHV